MTKIKALVGIHNFLVEQEEVNEDWIVFLKKEIETLREKSFKAAEKATEKRLATNNTRKELILKVLHENETPLTATGLAVKIDKSVQWTAAGLKKLAEEGLVIRNQEGKKVTFSLSKDTTDTDD